VRTAGFSPFECPHRYIPTVRNAEKHHEKQNFYPTFFVGQIFSTRCSKKNKKRYARKKTALRTVGMEP